jgi:HK97 gp10 family phage protein
MPTYATLKSRIPEVIALIDTATDAQVKALAEDIANAAKEKVEVESGDLQDSIRAVPIDDNTYSVQAGDDDVFYGHFVEYGTQASAKHHATAPKPFLIPAFVEVASLAGRIKFKL